MIVALENTRGGVLKRLLSNDRVTYLGRISYGTYLWHWPVIILLTYHRSIAPIELFVLDCIVATSVAAVSFRVLENPIRVADSLSRNRRLVIAVGVMISVLVGAVFMPIVLDPGNRKWLQARNDIPPAPSCFHKPVEKCIVVHGGGRRIILVGDSTARMWIPALTEIAKRESLTFAVAVMPDARGNTAWQYALVPGLAQRCRKVQDDWYNRDHPAIRPGHRRTGAPRSRRKHATRNGQLHRPRRRTLPMGRRELRTQPDRRLPHVARALQRPGRRLVIIEPTPESPGTFDPLNCLSQGRAPWTCRYRAPVQPTQLEWAYRAVAKARVITTLNMDRVICPQLPICTPILHDNIVTRDGRHLTATFARSIWNDLDRRLRQAHVLP